MKQIFLLLAAIFALMTLQAEPLFDKGILRGTIIDSTAQSPLPYANILLYKQNDSTFITGTNSGINGEFILNNIVEGNYVIKVNLLGYQNKYITNLVVNKDKAEYNTGVIMLTKKTLLLNEAEIIGEKPTEELHLDKKVINVSQNLTSAGGTALDVLQNQPSVRVDADGNVYLRGSANFTILINGKPNILQGADALKQISANSIDNIELITNPSSKYDAEGSAGIININLKKQSDYTLSGIVNVNSGTNDKYNSDFSGSFNYDGLNVTAGLEYRNNTNNHGQDINKSTYNTNDATDLEIRSKRKEYTARTSLDYNINNQDALSLSLSGGKIEMEQSLTSDVIHKTTDSTEFVENFTLNNYPIKYFNSSLNYTHKFVPNVNEVSMEASFSNVNFTQEQNSNEYVSDNTFITRNSDPFMKILSNSASREEGRGKITYSDKLTDKSTLELGLQSNFSYREFDVVNNIYDRETYNFKIDSSLTNNYSYRNNVYAGFISYSNQLFNFDFQLGLRGEYMDRLLKQNTLGNNYKYQKMDYFPSFSISRNIDDHQLQLSFSRRVNRPDENLLNPFPFYQDKYIYSSGDPYLLPEYTNSYEFNYQKVFGSVFFSVQTYFRNTNNVTTQTFGVDDQGRLAVKFSNVGKSNDYGSEISASFPVTGIVKLDPGIGLGGTDFNGNIGGMNIDKQFFNWNARLNGTFTITPDTRFMVSGNYYGRMIQPQMVIKPFFLLNASLKQDLFEKKLSLTLQARNILRTSYLNVTASGTDFISTVKVKQEVPVIMLMASYNFNNFKKVQRPSETINVPSGL